MRSLQRRVIIGGLIWAGAALLIGAYAVFVMFDQIADRRFNAFLQERHTQVVVALGTMQSADGIEGFLTDPAYSRPYSGRYWQLQAADGTITTSPSLFDFELPAPADVPDAAEIWEGEGPNGPLRGVRQRIVLDDGTVWIATIASSLADLSAERLEMRRSVAGAFALVGLLCIAGAGLLTSAVLAPLRKLRNDVAHRWDAGKELEPADYPLEVAPLVRDINELLSRNRDIVERGRRQAADLAHALKTPSAALRNEVAKLSRTVDGTAPLFQALDRIDGQITRSLARMRAVHASKAVLVRAELDRTFDRLTRLFRSLPDTSGKDFRTKSPAGLCVAADPQDLEEILGNLLENAFKWCRNSVRLSAASDGQSVTILVEDDGPGITQEQRAVAMREGGRLDTSVPGTGLGLSIANDLAQAYGGTIALETSPALGGLMIELVLPMAISPDHTVSNEPADVLLSRAG